MTISPHIIDLPDVSCPMLCIELVKPHVSQLIGSSVSCFGNSAFRSCFFNLPIATLVFHGAVSGDVWEEGWVTKLDVFIYQIANGVLISQHYPCFESPGQAGIREPVWQPLTQRNTAWQKDRIRYGQSVPAAPVVSSSLYAKLFFSCYAR